MTRVSALGISLFDQSVGVLVRYKDGVTELVFDPDYRSDANRYTLTTGQLKDEKILDSRHRRSTRITPILANLLPEGALRSHYVSELKTHEDDDFALLAALGSDLPGGITARPLNSLPPWFTAGGSVIESDDYKLPETVQKFSLAGVQMKFSSDRVDGRFTIGDDRDWIIKTPSTRHPHVPENEFSVMSLAKAVGISVPKFELIELSDISNLPDVNLPKEHHAYAIKRFDRENGNRVHMEDFAQVFDLYPGDKYKKANYEKIGRILYTESIDGLGDLQEMARRLIVNILLGNGDAHLKNWTVLFPDRKVPALSPAYDIVSTVVYIPGDHYSALNMGREKDWNNITLNHFYYWIERVGPPKRVIERVLNDVIEIATDVWPSMLKDLPMHEPHKIKLTKHIDHYIKQLANMP